MSVTEALAEYVTHSTSKPFRATCATKRSAPSSTTWAARSAAAVEPALDVAIETLAPFSGNATACVLGRAERFDALHAALLNGIGSHVHEYDDTLPKNYIHPSVPVASALFAYASANPVSGRDFVHAFILGFEVESRIGNAVYPAHYTAGWHITSTTGVFGAAAAIGKLLGLTHEADGLGVRPRGDASRRHPRDVRLDGEVVPAGPRRAERLHGRAARPRRLHGRRARARRAARLRGRDRGAVRPRQDHGRARQGLRAARQRLQAVRVRPRRASDDRRLQPAASRASSVARRDRRRAPARGAARARSVQQERLQARAREQVLDLSRGGHRPRARQGRPARVHRRGGRGPGACSACAP